MNKTIVTIALLLFHGMLLAQDAYMVNLTIHRDGVLVGSPSIAAEINKDVSVSVSNQYNVSLKIEEREGEKLYIQFNLNVNEKDYSPALVVSIDSEASIEVGKMKLTVVVSKAST